MKKYWAILIIALLATSCTIAPKPINYNVDQCHACKMIISDNRFGAELVTKKGKVFTYDAIECLVPEVHKHGQDYYAHMVVTDYTSPETFIDARDAIYLISPERPSPMGRNLSAYSNKADSLSPDDQWYEWDGLLKRFLK